MSHFQMEPPPIRSLPDLTPKDYNPQHPVIGEVEHKTDIRDSPPAFQQITIVRENYSINDK